MITVVPVVILAGGQGSRMGGGKPERLLGGCPLLDHAIATAARYSSVVSISVRAGTQLSVGDVPIIDDDGDIEGPIAGLATALKFAAAAGASYVMIMPCDTPFLPGDMLQRLHGMADDAVAAVAHCAGQSHPACSLWRVDAASLLPDYLAGGRRSLMGFAEAVGYVPVEWPGSDADRFFNINTDEDLRRAEQIYAGR